MKLIIPMAGRGTRLRPHTLTTPKPLLPVAGPMLIERIIKSFVTSLDRDITEIAYILGDFGREVEDRLAKMTRHFGAKPVFYRQDVALGTAHAVNCAADSLSGEVIIAFADTLFRVSGKVDLEGADSVIWLKQVDNPSQFGVAVQEDGRIIKFVEKPNEPISDMAIIGVYYFRNGERLQKELQYVMDNDIRGHKNEFDLTDAINRMLQMNAVFKAVDVEEWLDFGTIQAWIDSTAAVLDQTITPNDPGKQSPGNTIIPPSYIGDNVHIENSTIGPYASISPDCKIKNSTITNSIIREHSQIRDSILHNATVGTSSIIADCELEIHVGDFSQLSKK